MTEVRDLENKELLEEYYKNVKYKESLIEERRRVDEKYENMYIQYLEGVNKVDELRFNIAPIEEEISKNNNLHQENDKQIKTFLTDGEQLKTIKENLKEQSKNQCKKYTENMNKIYEKMRELPETFTNVAVEDAINEAEKHSQELTETKESLIIKLNNIKQESNKLKEYDIPSNIKGSLKLINISNIKHFGDVTKNTSTVADIQKNINTLKKTISEVESEQNVDSH